MCQTRTYLVSGEGIGDIEAGVPETGDKGVDAEMGQQFLDIIDILILNYHNVADIPILKYFNFQMFRYYSHLRWGRAVRTKMKSRQREEIAPGIS